MTKHQQMIDFTVTWFDKHYSPSKQFRKRELEDSAQFHACKDNHDRYEKRLDHTWNQKFTQNFGKLRGMEVPDRRALESITIKSSWDGSFPSMPSQGSTWVGGSRRLGNTWSSGATAPKVPQLHIPDKTLDGAIGQRPQSAGLTPSIGGSSVPSTPSIGGARVPAADAAERIRQARGVTRASTAPSALGNGPLFQSPIFTPTGTASRSGRSAVPPTSNTRYGWIEVPSHLAYKPKNKVRAEEVVYKEFTIKNRITYSPRYRF